MSDFWQQTPRLIRAAIAGHIQRQRYAMTVAWHGAAYGRVETMPSLASALGDDEPAQTDDDILFNLAAFASATQAPTAE